MAETLSAAVPQWNPDGPTHQDAKLGPFPVRIRRLQPEQVQSARNWLPKAGIISNDASGDQDNDEREWALAKLVQIATVSEGQDHLVFPGEEGLAVLRARVKPEAIEAVAIQILTFNEVF